MFSAKQGNYLVPFLLRLWYDAVLDWEPPALDASTIPLGYRGARTRRHHSITRLSRKRLLQ